MRFALRLRRFAAVPLGLAALLALPVSASHYHRGPTSSHAGKSRHAIAAAHRGERASSSRPRAIDDARASQIQTALVKAGYLQTASGKWDSESADAMRKLQGDNGWQTKLIPDSRALIKLGLGPGSEAPAETVNPPVAATPVLHSDGQRGQQ